MKQLFAAILFAMLLTWSPTIQAQQETEHWYFGENAGMRFNSLNPSVLTNGKVNTPEGCSAISDNAGNLLFYTDGISVWNRNHQRMTNGFGLKGDPSSSQSALIIKKPGNNQIYYIFSVAARAELPGLRYSEVNMMLDGGKGDVAVKNTLLLTPVAEKLTAVNHRQDEDVWVLAHKWGDSSFYAYPVTAAGIGNPVISQAGMVHGGNTDNALGCMKASPDGTKIALAIQHSNTFELFNFDDRSGVVSNPITFSNPQYKWAYGVEFSPDGSKLYGTSMGIPGMIFQFDISVHHLDSIRKTISVTGQARKSLYGSLQLAPNGRIYVAAADTAMLSVIQSPNNKSGMNRFFESGIFLQGKRSRFGLPSFNQNFFLAPNFKYKEVCFGDTMYFELRVPYKFQSVTYNFNDPASGIHNTSTLFNPAHYFTKPGNFDVVTTGPINNGSIRTTTTRVLVHPLPPVNLGADVALCPGDTIILGSTGTYKKYNWSTGAKEPGLPITEPGTYWLEVTSDFGCVDRDTIVVTRNPVPKLLESTRETICYGYAATFKLADPLATVDWPDSTHGPEYITPKAGKQAVTLHYNGCTITDTLEVVYKNCPDKLFFPNIITPDNDGQNDEFRIPGLAPGTANLTIYNRYGSKIFETNGYQQNWKAEGAAAGLYYYHLQLPELHQVFKGWIEVVK